jgi:hypothetical protein
MAQPSAANQIWPNLPQSTPSEVERETQASPLARSMYPRPKPTPTNPYRESLLKNLRELNARIRESGKR